jgi:hypothetical protein
MTIQLDALIERWPGEHLLYARELPGFCVAGANSTDLQMRSGNLLQTHLDWLVERDMIDEPASPVELSIVEELDSVSSDAGPRFMVDLVAPDEMEVETALAVGRAAVADLVDMYERAERTGDSAHTATLLQRIAQRDAWFGSRLTQSQSALVIVETSDPVDLLVHAAGAFEDDVDQFVLDCAADLWLCDREEWTLAKVLRRRTAHLRRHLGGPRDGESGTAG